MAKAESLKLKAESGKHIACYNTKAKAGNPYVSGFCFKHYALCFPR